MGPESLRCPVSVLIAVKNEARNLGRCLEAIRDWADEVVVVDSQSTDDTAAIADRNGAAVVQFHYQGGWPKKRQWALETYPFRNDWILILDADEILSDPVKREIASAIRNPDITGYYLTLQTVFLGRMLRFAGSNLRKLALFRKGRGHYEKRIERQDTSMQDMEIHEHVVVNGTTGFLRSPVRHENINSLERYIEKHNAYSNWEARVLTEGSSSELPPSLFGNQAQRRRWVKKVLVNWPGISVLRFFYKYLFRLGFADGIPGLIYCAFDAIQLFHVKAKIYELRLQRRSCSKP